jgi:hypothetical protein
MLKDFLKFIIIEPINFKLVVLVADDKLSFCVWLGKVRLKSIEPTFCLSVPQLGVALVPPSKFL